MDVKLFSQAIAKFLGGLLIRKIEAFSRHFNATYGVK